MYRRHHHGNSHANHVIINSYIHGIVFPLFYFITLCTISVSVDATFRALILVGVIKSVPAGAATRARLLTWFN